MLTDARLSNLLSSLFRAKQLQLCVQHELSNAKEQYTCPKQHCVHLIHDLLHLLQ